MKGRDGAALRGGKGNIPGNDLCRARLPRSPAQLINCDLRFLKALKKLLVHLPHVCVCVLKFYVLIIDGFIRFLNHLCLRQFNKALEVFALD
eukprot:XP_001706980.1 Hypothetical protein GL50803_96006 [Giardia lamblia ATCC 50803]